MMLIWKWPARGLSVENKFTRSVYRPTFRVIGTGHHMQADHAGELLRFPEKDSRLLIIRYTGQFLTGMSFL